jgi:D-alanyl-D-alanine carboxypeptidase (penicillin-binding protein 5/6)
LLPSWLLGVVASPIRSAAFSSRSGAKVTGLWLRAGGVCGWLNRSMRASQLAERGRGSAWPVAGGLVTTAVLVAAVLAAGPAAAMVIPAPGGVPAGGPRAAPAAQLAAGAAVGAPQAGVPVVDDRGGELVNASTGARLWGKDVTRARPMGSITKVMTALVVLRAGDLNRRIMVTRSAIRYVHRDGASSAGLIAGDVLTARQLLEAMLLPSGCDAAYLLATSYGPGRRVFVAKMNATARALGLTSTYFTSFDGMPYPTEHSTYSSPADLIRIGEQTMRYRLFRRIVAQRRYRLAATADHHRYVWHTTNHLIGSYRGALGIKTGDTIAAGNCLLFAAARDDRTLIGVVLHVDPNSNFAATFAAARHLLTWGFHRN